MSQNSKINTAINVVDQVLAKFWKAQHCPACAPEMMRETNDLMGFNTSSPIFHRITDYLFWQQELQIKRLAQRVNSDIIQNLEQKIGLTRINPTAQYDYEVIWWKGTVKGKNVIIHTALDHSPVYVYMENKSAWRDLKEVLAA